jgi:hypothetical protein
LASSGRLHCVNLLMQLRFAATQSRVTECLLFVERSCFRSGVLHVVGRSMSMMTNHYYRGGLNRAVGGGWDLVGIFLIRRRVYCDAELEKLMMQ